MAPAPQEPALQQEIPPQNRVVISGMSGLYPNSHNVEELSNILYNKVNPVTTENIRWTFKHPEVGQHLGAVPGLNLFDGQFFRVHQRLGDHMDPMSRKLLEESFKAIYDAGLTPEHLTGKKIGVYIGTSFSESEKATTFIDSPTGFLLQGSSKTMFANRISYWLNGKGPSHSIDGACCSSSMAIEEAYKAIRRGDCDAAIAGGCSICLHPQTTINCGRVTKLPVDGKTRSFDRNANGPARSEAVAIVFLQKAKDALRIYGELVHIKNEYIGLKEGAIGPKFGFDRDPETSASFIKKVYDEAGIPPSVVEYVEAFGSADPEADKNELETLARVFKRDKQSPLLVGSVMSNIGYTEAVTGLAAVTKVLLGYHKRELAGNLHYETPHLDVGALNDGSLKVLSDHHVFGGDFAAVNGLSITGVNSHILLHGNYKPKDLNRYKSSIPHLVTVSARTEEAVEKMLKKLKVEPVDPEQIALFHNIHRKAISGHLGRGYIILDTDIDKKTVSLSEQVAYFDDVKRPLVFVYSGMGSQWAGMGAQLMKIPIFSAAIERCDRVLKPKGIDIVHIITSPEKNIFDNILHSFVGIAAVQIGLTDVLRALGLVPDVIIGHSVGEIGCAYADGCFTAEETILSSYSRGLVSVQTPFIKGTMAAVGIGYKKIKDMCPPEIEVACHNGPDSCTISGPQDAMRRYIEKLEAENVFVKEVPCSNIAYHSRYIAEAGPALQQHLSLVIDTPKRRSERWLSTSVPIDEWDHTAAKYSSAEYHTNNLLNPVYFEETCRLLPSNGVMIEIAPHGLLQAILKRSLPETCTHVPLTRRGHADNAIHVLEAIGKLYLAGYEPNISALYPKIEFPVSTGTPFLSSFVHWNHNEKWNVCHYMTPDRNKTASCKFIVSVHDDDYSFLKGHVIRGKTVFPYAAVLELVWDTLAMSTGRKKKQTSVRFTNLCLYTQPLLHDKKCLTLHVHLHRGTGMFEVLNCGSTVAAGYIVVEERKKEKKIVLQQKLACNEHRMTCDEVYQVLKSRGYFYSGDFRSISDISESYNEAHIKWNSNWITFIDSLMQMYTLSHGYEGVSEPRLIRTLRIDVQVHKEHNEFLKNTLMEANFVPELDFLCCGGVVLENMLFRDLPLIAKEIELKCLKFDPRFSLKDNEVIGVGEYILPYSEGISGNSLVTLKTIRPGDIDSLKWVEQSSLKGSGIPVTVHYFSLSHRDAKKAMGLNVNGDLTAISYAMEFSGVTDSGERVMGLLPEGAASSRVLAIPDLLWPVPDFWSLEDAATVPLAYAQVFYCWFMQELLGDIKNVFVHCGAGGLGQAVISIALAHNFRVFTTVGSQEKKQFLLKLFPKLNEQDIGNSRDHSFADMVLSLTHGEGCAVAFSCVEGLLKNSTLRICGTHGRTFDFSQLPNSEDYSFGLYNLTKCRSYVTIDMASIFLKSKIMKKIQKYIAEGIAQGYVVPLTRITFSSTEVPRAFKLLVEGKNRGRVLVKVNKCTIPRQPRITCSSSLHHLVITDDYDCGLQWANRLFNRGATKIKMHSFGASDDVLSRERIWRNPNWELEITYGEHLKGTKEIFSLITDCIKAGPIQGVYVISVDGRISEKTVDSLDVVLRQLSSELKYFAVVSGDISLGNQTCASRVKDNLTANKLILPAIKKNNICQSHIDAIERALCSKEAVLIAGSQEDLGSSLLNQIASVAKIEIPSGVLDTVTLESLGLNDIRAKIVSSFLRNTYNIVYDEEILKSFTLESIKHLDSVLLENKQEFQEMRGLNKFFMYVDTDELMNSAEMMIMPTLINSSNMRTDEFDSTQEYLCIVPGLECSTKRFNGLCERLKLPALVLQPGSDKLRETIPEMAQRYVEVLVKKIGLKCDFNLLGYESGVLIALEMAAILEDIGFSGTVYCIGASPEDFKAILEKELLVYKTDEDLQDAVVQHIAVIMGGDEKKLPELRKYPSWDEKVQGCVRNLLGRVPYSAQYIEIFIKSAYARILQVRNYKPKVSYIRSQIIFARAAKQNGNILLNTEKPIVIYDLEEPLEHASTDVRCSNIINRHLNKQLTEAFNERNICDSYLANGDTYMALKCD